MKAWPILLFVYVCVLIKEKSATQGKIIDLIEGISPTSGACVMYINNIVLATIRETVGFDSSLLHKHLILNNKKRQFPSTINLTVND